MTHTILPMVNWGMGTFGIIFMFVVFLALVVALLLLMRGGKKK